MWEKIVLVLLQLLVENKKLIEITIFGIVFAFVTVVFPIYPTRYLSKFRSSKSSAKGPFQGLSIRLSGPVATYFILFVALFSLSGSLGYYCFGTETNVYKIWKVQGWVELNENDDKSKIEYSVKPKRDLYVVYPGEDGDFTVTGVVLPKKTSGDIPKTKLYVHMDGYGTKPITLDKEHYKMTDLVNSKKDKLKYDEETNTIITSNENNPICLKKMAPYNPTPNDPN